MNTAATIALLLRTIGSRGSAVQRARRLASFPVSGQKRVVEFLTTHSKLVSDFAVQIGLGESIATSLRHTYEQWDGKGYPLHLRGEAISLSSRLAQLAGPAEVFGRRSVDAARRMLLRHRGTQFDPAIVDLFTEHASELLDGLDEASDWDALLNTQPALSRRVSGDDLDRVLEAMADLVDLKSPHLAGHSRGVANLAAEAARVTGMPQPEITTLRRAGLLHDLGRLGVSNSILDKPGPLTPAESERIRLHPYLTDRMLARVSALDRSRQIAARHHERLDGSGYPHGLGAPSLTPSDRLLAAADSYHAMTEPRPYRAAFDAASAARLARDEVGAGRLDGDAVNAVLKAAGHRAPARRAWPGGLTAREVDVLVLLARGHSNKEIARRLVVTPKTVSNHIEHRYTKLDISSRVTATLYATQQGLMGTYEAR